MHRRLERSLHVIEGPVAALLERPLTTTEVEEITRSCNGLATRLSQLGLSVGAELVRDVQRLCTGETDSRSPALHAARALEDLRIAMADTEAGLTSAAAPERVAVLTGTPTAALDTIALSLALRGVGLRIEAPGSDPIGRADALLVAIAPGEASQADAILAEARTRRSDALVFAVVSDDDGLTPEARRHIHAKLDIDDPGAAAEQVLVSVVHAERAPQILIVSGSAEPRNLPHRSAEFEQCHISIGAPAIAVAAKELGVVSVVLDRVPHDQALAVATLLRTEEDFRTVRVVAIPSYQLRVSQRIELLRAGADITLPPDTDDDEVVATVTAGVRRHRRMSDVDTSDARAATLSWTSVQLLAERLLGRQGRSGHRASLARLTIDDSVTSEELDAAMPGLVSEFRREDIVGRFNDREAVVLLPGLPRNVAVKRFASLVDRVGLDADRTRVGISEFPADGRTLEVLLDSAGSTILRTKRAQGPRIAASDWVSSATAGADVLIIDPDAAHRAVMRTVLEERDLTVAEVSNGIEALARLVNQDRPPLPRAILLEFDLDGLDGLRLLRQLRSNGLMGRFQVLMLASRSDEFELRTAYELGAVDSIRKPFVPLVLGHRVDQMISRTDGPS
jgi:DNA-binding response OmpR family regulator